MHLTLTVSQPSCCPLFPLSCSNCPQLLADTQPVQLLQNFPAFIFFICLKIKYPLYPAIIIPMIIFAIFISPFCFVPSIDSLPLPKSSAAIERPSFVPSIGSLPAMLI